MTPKEKLEDRNAFLAKEILLNEAAIEESEKEIDQIEPEIANHEQMLKKIYLLKFFITRMKSTNRLYREEFVENEKLLEKLL